MLEVGDQLMVYEKLLWPISKVVEFSFIDKTGQSQIKKGLVSDILRDIHSNKLILTMGEEQVDINFPDNVLWNDITNELILEYGKVQDINNGFMDELNEAEWGESPTAALKRLNPKSKKSLIIKVQS